jgi:hypothetical protein
MEGGETEAMLAKGTERSTGAGGITTTGGTMASMTEVAEAEEATVEGRGFLALRGLEEDEEPRAAFEVADFAAEARRGRGLFGDWVLVRVSFIRKADRKDPRLRRAQGAVNEAKKGQNETKRERNTVTATANTKFKFRKEIKRLGAIYVTFCCRHFCWKRVRV